MESRRMNRPRDRASAAGLLPRMEARAWADGKTVTYRYHPVGGKPLALGTDRDAAIRKVLDMLGKHSDAGTIGRLWQQYKSGPMWSGLKPRTQADYEAYSVPLLRVFGPVHAADITPPDVARYLRVERADAPVRANREFALLSILIGLAVERGEATTNPCRGKHVTKNKERPRSEAPQADDIKALITHAYSKGGQWRVIVMAAEFAALVGARQVEMLPLAWPAFGTDEVRLERGKQAKGVKRVEKVAVSPALLALRSRLLATQRSPLGAVFPNRKGNAYTGQGFAAMWGKLMREAMAGKVIARRFTFHDLRAAYVTEHKIQTGNLPDLHASATTTSRVYDRAREAKRRAL
jgi:integrase